MAYLEEFQKQIKSRNFNKFFQLWEEYCTNDTVDAEELIALLRMIKESDFSEVFGKFIETALPIWGLIEDEEKSYEILKLILDLQTTNSKELAENALSLLQKKYHEDPHFKERMRMIGLRTRVNFQGCISNYELLAHLKVGNCVFHTGGWGTGEIMEVSLLREQLTIEFENVPGLRHLSFTNAFKNLKPLPKDHFLSQRFTNPDALEEQAKKDPIPVLHLLLRDLGPKNAQEIKDELYELVIPEDEWVKWWQNSRARVKKDTLIETPNHIKKPFRLRKEEISHEDRLLSVINDKTSPEEILSTCYSFIRDLPSILKKAEVKDELLNKLLAQLNRDDLSKETLLQLTIFLDNTFNHQPDEKPLQQLIENEEDIESIIENMEIVAFKKLALKLVKKYRTDWAEIFSHLLFSLKQKPLRDFILEALSKDALPRLEQKLDDLKNHPLDYPEVLVWYFQMITKKGAEEYPFSDTQGKCLFFEAVLILLSSIEDNSDHRDLVKKIVTSITQKRFELIRHLFEKAPVDFVREFLLLFAKCHCFSNQDKKILKSLAQVAHPSLETGEEEPEVEENILWTTEEGYNRTKSRMEQISTVEMIATAKEIEEARALGDLRENAEFKAAKEKRARLQGELKMLSTQINQARILNSEDIVPGEVGVGTSVTMTGPKGERITYTILGPWETDPENSIISFQSKLAQAMKGRKAGENFIFRDEEYLVQEVKSYFE